MVIRNTTVTLEVADVLDAYRQVEQIAGEMSGHVSAAQMHGEGGGRTATVTIRVPGDTETYGYTMSRLRTLAERVLDEQVQAQDVTEEFVDLDARGRTLRLTEERLLTLYERASRVEDVLAVQRELTAVRGQIEQAQGRQLGLSRRSAMATVTVQLRPVPPAVKPPPPPREWSPMEELQAAAVGLVSALKGVARVGIWAVVWLPLYGLPLLGLWWLRRWVRSNTRRAAG